MTFVQIIDYETSHYEDVSALVDRYLRQSQGRRTVTHSLIGKDRESATHYVDVVEFPSYEVAMENSRLPETDRMFREMVELCDGMPKFTNLDVVRDEHLNTHLVNRMFDEVAMGGRYEVIEEVFTSDYLDHDVGKASDDRGREAVRHDVEGWRSAFDFTFRREAQLAEGDLVTTVWTWTGTHKGEFLGMAPTGRTCTMPGTTTFRCRDGQIAEGWWHYDAMGLMRQLGAA
ncbi:ester cyclase [Streptomyces sp. NPDC097619]|uniref:ester cyclase n=1 Tax=Streptomyces sp. NPDC097619 TaxID=3157228 RepID=UPI00331EBBDD